MFDGAASAARCVYEVHAHALPEHMGRSGQDAEGERDVAGIEKALERRPAGAHTPCQDCFREPPVLDCFLKLPRNDALDGARLQFTTVHEFLGLTSAEMALIDMKVALARALKALRRHRRLTQAQVAKRLGSSQSRVAKMEAGDSSVSMDLLVRSLFALGASKGDLARAFLRVA